MLRATVTGVAGYGFVVNVPSIPATTGVGSNVAYCAAKAGLDTMTASLARTLAPRILVQNVTPGVVDTSFVSGRGPDFNDEAAATTPRGRIGTPDDMAAAIEACATHLTLSTGMTIIGKYGPIHQRATERARKSACAGREYHEGSETGMIGVTYLRHVGG